MNTPEPNNELVDDYDDGHECPDLYEQLDWLFELVETGNPDNNVYAKKLADYIAHARSAAVREAIDEIRAELNNCSLAVRDWNEPADIMFRAIDLGDAMSTLDQALANREESQ